MMGASKMHVFSFFVCCFLIEQTHEKWPPECETNRIVHNGICYVTITAPNTYSGAKNVCFRNGGNIAMMKTSLIQALIVDDFRKKNLSIYIWTGVDDLISEGNFTYADQTSLNSFVPWGVGLPRKEGYYPDIRDCVFVDSKELWIDGYCEYRYYFACEFERLYDPCNIQELTIPHAKYKSCYTEDTINYGDSLPIECHEGYVLVGPTNVTCLAESEWSPKPKCVEGCLPPKQLPHARFLNFKDVYTIGSQVTYVCNDGYATRKQKRSHSQITCGPNGKWRPDNSGCLLEEKYTIGTMDVESEISISIPCVTFNVEDGTGKTFIDKMDSYLWSINSKNINETILEYEIDVNGTLMINNFNENSVGHFICFQKDTETNNLIPGRMGFDLKLKPAQCPPSDNETTTITLREESSFVLRCPHTSSDHDFTWFKDDQRFYVRSDQTMFPDGSLYTETMRYSDQGTYTCRMFVKDTLCERNRTIQIIVLASASTVCGQVDPKYLHPWAVSLFKDDEIAPFCYGALINEQWVVTSANCLAGFNRKKTLNVFVRFSYPETDPFAGLVDPKVQAVKVHPKFSKKLFINDVGLVQLQQPVRFTRSIRPICLTENDLTIKQPCDRSSHINGTVVGWGPLEKDDYEEFMMLNETMCIVINGTDICSENTDLKTTICSMKVEGTITTLAGDAGSPLEIFQDDRYYLLGVYSWGERIVLSGDKDYFTKISEYVLWLKSFTERSYY